MAYQLSADLEVRVKAFLKDGQYETEDDVLREAMTTLEQRREEAETMASIRRGLEDEAAGRMRPFSEVDADIQKKFGMSLD